MLNILTTTIFILIYFIPLYSNNDLHLIIYFDINKTLIASDQACKKSVEDVLNELLAEKYEYIWEDSLPEAISFDAYVKSLIFPDALGSPDLRNQRLFYIHHFLDYLKERDHPLLPAVLQDYETALTVLNNSSSIIFPSFYYLLNDLDQKEISYSIILRSFGEDIFDVKNEINVFYKKIFAHMGEFHKGKLYLEEAEVLEGHQTIYNRLRRIDHIAIHDDWNYWTAHKMCAQQGKPFYIHKADEDTLSVFFDDNIREKNSPKNIIAPLDAVTGSLIPIEELVESGQAVRVQTLKAITEPNYFISHINKAIHKWLESQLNGES